MGVPTTITFLVGYVFKHRVRLTCRVSIRSTQLLSHIRLMHWYIWVSDIKVCHKNTTLIDQIINVGPQRTFEGPLLGREGTTPPCLQVLQQVYFAIHLHVVGDH